VDHAHSYGGRIRVRRAPSRVRGSLVTCQVGGIDPGDAPITSLKTSPTATPVHDNFQLSSIHSKPLPLSTRHFPPVAVLRLS
jgi:hypothetical protein